MANSKINAPKVLSPAMAAFMGKSKAPVGTVLKEVSKYISDNDLRDEDGKIHFDDVLQELFGCRSVPKQSALMKKIWEHVE